MDHRTECSEEQLVLYHYAELPPAERLAVEKHLADCPDCRTVLAEMQSSLAALPRVELRLSAAQKLTFAERVSSRTRRSAPGMLPRWGGALIAAGVFGAAVMLISPADRNAPLLADTPARSDFELVEQLDLLQDLALLQNFELLQEIESL
jgi:anti-sigma factor RsiW